MNVDQKLEINTQDISISKPLQRPYSMWETGETPYDQTSSLWNSPKMFSNESLPHKTWELYSMIPSNEEGHWKKEGTLPRYAVAHAPLYNRKDSYGAITKVFKAFDKQTGRYVALKTLQKGIADQEDWYHLQDIFFKEAKTMASVEHQNILPIYTFFSVDQMQYPIFSSNDYEKKSDVYIIVLPFRDPQYHSTLSKIIQKASEKNKTIPIKKTIEYMEQMARAADYMAEKGLLHRDLKPSNIWLSTDETNIQVFDFGLAGETGKKVADFQGTVQYVSPERAAHGGIENIQSEVYSIGTIFYKLLTGKNLFGGNNPDDDAHAILILNEILTLDGFPEEAKQELRNNPSTASYADKIIPVLDKSHRKNPDLRQTTAIELIQEFKEALK